MADSNPEKNICPCCGRREGMLLVHTDTGPAGGHDLLAHIWKNRTADRRSNGYHVLCNRQCQHCEFAWRMADAASFQARPHGA